jgi:membrane protease YdiL (CAAX protease family)
MVKTEQILGIDKNFIIDSLWGIGIGILIIVLGEIFAFIGTIGIPLNLVITLDELGQFIVIVAIAPIAEEIFFRQFVLSFFDDKIENFGVKVPFFLSAILTGIIFSIFHIAAYGGSLAAAGGSFFSAAFMGVVFAYEVKVFKSVLPAILTHAVVNFAILSALLVIIG